MPSPILRRGDVLAGLCLAALGAYIALQSLAWQVLGPSGPGPGFFPLIYGTLMVGLSLALVVRAASRRAVRADAPQETAARGDTRAAITIWILFVAAVAAIKYVGFLVSLGLLLLLVSRLIYARPLWQGAAAAILGPALFYLIFSLGLQVRLPTGTLTGL